MSTLRLHVPTEDSGTPTVQDVIFAYLAQKRGGSARVREDREHVLRAFLRTFGAWPVTALCPDDLESWVADQGTLKSDWSRRRWGVAVLGAMNWAHQRKRLIPYNPVAGARFHAGQRGRPLTDREYAAIIREATDARFRRFVMFLHYTGCRPGEAASATWDDVDLTRLAVVLRHHKTEHLTSAPRVIYLPPPAVRLLGLIARTDKQPMMIFVNACGRPWRNSTLSERMKTIRRRAGIPKDAKLYGARHRYATDAILSGVDLATVAELMGHRGTRTTSHYVHLAGRDDHLRDAVAKVHRRRK